MLQQLASLLLLVAFCFLSLTAQAATPDANTEIHFRFRAGAQEGAPVSPAPAAGKIRCYSLLGSFTEASYKDTFTKGSNFGKVDVSAEFSPYRCRISFPGKGFASSIFTTSAFDIGETEQAESYVYARNDEFRVQVVDPSGTAITGIPVKLSLNVASKAQNPFGLEFRPAFAAAKTVNADTGRTKFDLVENEVYRLRGRPGFGSSQPGTPGTAGGGSTTSVFNLPLPMTRNTLFRKVHSL